MQPVELDLPRGPQRIGKVMIEIINLILILFLFVCAVAAVLVTELVSAVFLLGCSSFFLAVLWSVLAAPDVSFTEAMVGVGASTIFFLLTLFCSRHFTHDITFSYRPWLGLCSVMLLGVLLFWGSQDMPLFGDPQSAPNTYLSPYYLRNTWQDSQTPNAVTAVVTDYRGFDTLMETSVIFTAGIACLLILRKKP